MLTWHSVLDRTTFSRLLKSLTFEEIVGIENLVHTMRNKIWEGYFLPKRDTDAPIIIDLDSIFKTSYGSKQGSEKRFNSSKKGVASFHPQLAFCSVTKEILQGWYKCGSANTSNRIIDFMKQLTAQLHLTENFYFRADSGYFSENLLSYLEDIGYEYLIKIKMKNLSSVLENQTWSDIEGKKG